MIVKSRYRSLLRVSEDPEKYPSMLDFEEQVRSYLRDKLGMEHASNVPNLLSILWGGEFPPANNDPALVNAL